MRKVFYLIALLLSASVLAPAVSADDAKVKKVLGGLVNVIAGATSGTTTSGTASRLVDDGKIKAITDVDGLVVKVKSCTANDNGNVVIVFTLENQTRNDMKLTLSKGASEVYDDEGNVYKGHCYSDVITFALNDGTSLPGDGCSVNVSLPSGILTKYKVKIKDVDPVASMIKLVKIPFMGNKTSLTFKNIPITREGD